MKTALSAIVALCAAVIVIKDARHWRTGDRRHASFRTVVVSVLILLGLSLAAQARPSPYPPVTSFVGDRYGSAQLGPDVVKEVRRLRAGKKLNRRSTAAQRSKGQPNSRRKYPVASGTYRADVELSLGGGIRREAARVIGGRPAGCPPRFCGCGASLHLFGRIIPKLNLAANWLRFPRAEPAPKMAAARHGHVFVLEHHIRGDVWMVFDANSGRGRTRIHPRSIAGYRIVNPHGAS